MKILSLHLLLICLLYCTSGLCQPARSKSIDALLKDLYQKKLFNGAIVAGQKDKLIISKGYGYANFKDSVLFTTHTVSDGGSNAKTFTATAILMLAEEGKLNLTDPVQVYLPNYPYQNTTVWNLVTHSLGGLPDYDYFFDKAADTAIVTTSLNLDILNKEKPALFYAPGTNFYYDNVGFDLAALVVEKVTGKTYYQFLKERIFDPLHMDSSFVRPSMFSDWNHGRTMGYQFKNGILQIHDIADREGFYGGCNIWFTADDLYRWGRSFYQNPVLSEYLTKKITDPVFIKDRLSHVRQGAWYRGKSGNAFYYWGNVAGFYSWVYWDREKQFTIAFMTNTTMPQWVRPQLTSALINIMTGKKYQPITEPIADTLDRKKPEPVTGIYLIEGVGKTEIMTRNAHVILRVNDGMEYQMHLVDNKTFYIPGYDQWISFHSLKNGRYNYINWNSTMLQTTGKRISK